MSIGRYQSRKFLLVTACLITASALLVFGYISDTIWRDFGIATVAAYITGNVFDARTEAKHAAS